jgi:single-strand selective monofunctional uracil DNA glycosylase
LGGGQACPAHKKGVDVGGEAVLGRKGLLVCQDLGLVLPRPAEGKGVIDTKGDGLLLGLVFTQDTAFPLWTARFKMTSMIHEGLWASIQKRAQEMQQRDYSPKAPVTYNPLDYAAEPAEAYWRLLGQGPKKALFLGMNPGPWGMGQTGVPFGDPQMVREWMGIKGEVRQPESPLASRPVVGLESPRSEVSGSRLWGLIAKYYPRAADFFQHYVVWNYCPLIFFDPQDRNLTPDKLPAALRGPLEALCDQNLLEVLEAFHPREVIAVGGYAEKTALRVAAIKSIPVRRILHPSPANPAANRGWEEAVLQTLGEAFFLP